jgi:hypothetical protein
VLGYLLKDEPLVFRRLVVAAHTQVDRSANATGTNSSAHPTLWNYSAMLPPIPKLSNYPHGNGRYVATEARGRTSDAALQQPDLI